MTQLQNAEQDKFKLEKLLVGEKSTVPHNTDEVDSSKMSEISDMQAKIKYLSAAVEASENTQAEVEKIKGIISIVSNVSISHWNF